MDKVKLTTSDYEASNKNQNGDDLLTSSDISFGTENNSSSIKTDVQQGGFFWSDNGNNNDKKLLQAVKENRNEVVDFMVSNGMVNSYGAQDELGNNVLHYVAVGKLNNQVIDKILNDTKVEKALNVQNKHGDTPLIKSVISNNMSLTNKLLSLGANKDIANDSDFYVATEQSESNNDAVDSVTSMMDLFVNTNELSATSPDNVKSVNEPVQVGGVRNIRLGKRQLNIYTGESGLNNEKSVSDYSTSSGSELGRLIKKQSTEIHERVIQKIMKLMTVKEDVAKNYKAALYKQVKDKKPELGNLDRAVEMEKLVNQKNLKAIDIKKVTADIKKHIEERKKESDKSDSASSKDSKSSISKEASVNFSETSFNKSDFETSSSMEYN